MMRRELTYSIKEVTPYINWAYYFYAWQVKDKAGQERLRNEAMMFLDRWAHRYGVHALFMLGTANSDGDDIRFDGVTIPMLRQQHPDARCGVCLSLADFIRPLSGGIPDRMGIFATTVDMGLETDFAADEYQNMTARLLATRLAEAAAELLHEQVRRRYWGYAPDEQLSMDELHAEKFAGIRPAVGYPSLPDMGINFVLNDIIRFSDIGIKLTENGAMIPHASVSGLMMAHPAARYFSVGRIGGDQLADYARRRGVPKTVIRKFLIANIE